MNLRLGKTETFALAIMILIVSALVFWFFGYQPAKKEIESLIAQQNEVIKKIEENKLTLQRLAELKKESAKMEASIVSILTNLPTKPELPSYLVMINEIADRSGVKINNFKPAVPANEANYVKIPVELTVAGRFNDIRELGGSLIEFLYLLENMPRITKVESLNIVRSGNKQDLTVSIKMSTYSLVGLTSQIPAQGQQQTESTAPAQGQPQGQ